MTVPYVLAALPSIMFRRHRLNGVVSIALNEEWVHEENWLRRKNAPTFPNLDRSVQEFCLRSPAKRWAQDATIYRRHRHVGASRCGYGRPVSAYSYRQGAARGFLWVVPHK